MNTAFRKCVSRAAICAALAGPLLLTGLLRAEQVPLFQQGTERTVTLQRNQVLIIADDAMPLVDRAVQLAEAGVTDRLLHNSDRTTAVIEVAPGQVAPLLDQLKGLPGISDALPVVRLPDGTAAGVTGDLVAKHPGVTAEALATEYDLLIDEAATATLGLKDVTVFAVPDPDLAASFVRAAAMMRDGRMAFAHPDLLIPAVAYQSINDTLFEDQWHIENNVSNNGAELQVLEAWEETLGANIRIGMHDDGCVVSHPDLLPNFTGTSRDIRTNGSINPGGGHGTAVMGLMAAAANSIGVRGVAPEAEFTATGPLNAASTQVAGAYTFATSNDVDVHNNSWGFPFGNVPDIITDAVVQAANDGRDGLGLVLTWASGNSRRELDPGDDLSTLAEVIQVGATGQTDTIANYSNFGATQDIMGASQGSDGFGLVTTDNPGAGGLNNGQLSTEFADADYTRQMGGTSGAAPVVGGVAALILSVNPDLNRVQVREILTHTADQVSPRDADYDPVRGNSLRYGFGRVNAGAAVEAARDSLSGNSTWPPVARDFDVFIFESLDPDVDGVLAQITWEPGGMDIDDTFQTDQTQVLVVYRLNDNVPPSNFSPTDGTQYNGGDIQDAMDGNEVSEGHVVLYHGPAFAAGGRLAVPEPLVIEGDVDSPQQFAIFAANSNNLFSFGQVVNEDGDIVPRQQDGNDNEILPPPDTGNVINPELDPGEPGMSDPPSVGATTDRFLGRAPFEVNFFGSVQTPMEVRNRGWSFGDGSSTQEDTATHTYALPGVYNAVFFAENDLGISTKLIRIVVQDENGISGPSQTAPPTAAIELLSTQPLVAPISVARLTARTTGIGETAGSTVTYAWNFGDGVTGEGQTTEHTYARAGTYIVVVVVTEQLATGEVTQVTSQIAVEVAGSSGPSGFGTVDGNTDDGSLTGATAACGASAPALMMVGLAGLFGLSWTRRRRDR